MSNEVLVSAIQQGQPDLLLELYEKNRGLLVWCIRPYLGAGADEEDLLQEAFIALHEAANHYKPDLDMKFSAYCVQWVRAAVMRYLTNTGTIIRIPEYRRRQIQQVKRIRKRFEMEQGREPSRDEMCAYLAIYPEELEEIERAGMDVLSLSAPIEDGLTLGDTVGGSCDELGAVEDRAYNEQMSHDIKAALDGLDPEEAAILRRRYWQKMTVAEAASTQDVTTQQARAMEVKALRKLRRPEIRRMLIPYTEIFSSGVHGSGLKSYQRTGTSATERTAIHLIGASKEEREEI